MSRRPRISVLLPVRNGLPWLSDALSSLSAQTFDDFEILALEDGSTDATPDLLCEWPDPRLRVIPTGGVGIAHALNIGLEAARGDYIARQDADDLSAPERLQSQMSVLDAMDGIDVVASVAAYLDGSGMPVDNAWVRTVRAQQDPAQTPDAIRTLMPLTCCITHGSVMARTGVVRAAGGYRPEMVPAEDYDLWLRLLPTHAFVKLSSPLYSHRLHAAQSGARSRGLQTRRTILAKLQFLRRLFPALPSVARLALTGSARGNGYYLAVAPEAGFITTDPELCWDVLAITDFALVDEFERSLTGPGAGAVTRVGNCFVRSRLTQSIPWKRSA